MSEASEGRRRRVMLVAASNRRRGAEVFTGQLRDGLAARGWEVDAVCLTVADEGATVDLEPLTEIIAGETGRFSQQIFSNLRRRVRAAGPDVVVAMGGSTLRYASAAKPWSGARLAYFAIGEPRYWLGSRVAMAINRALYRAVDRIIAVSRMTASQLIELDPHLEDRVEIAGTGVTDEMFAVEPDSRDSGTLRVLFVGSLSPEKDPLMAVAAVSEIDGAALRFLGAGPLSSEVKQMTIALGIDDRIELHGAVEDVRPHLQWADVLLLTSKTEGLPGVILEAAAAGVPTVAVDVGGVQEAIDDGVTGLTVPRALPALTDALAMVATDDELLASMSSAARDKARREFRLDDSIDRFDRILQEMTA